MEELKLYIDRLRACEYKKFSFTSTPEIMECEDEVDSDVLFEKNIDITGEATLANDHLMININIYTTVKNYCKICNEQISHELSISEKHIPFSLKTMKSGVFHLKSYVQELIFLNIPKYSECKNLCPERSVIKKHLKDSKT